MHEPQPCHLSSLPIGPPPQLAAVNQPHKIQAKDWSLEHLLSNTNFRSVRRVSALLPTSRLLHELESHERDGLPLIIEGWHKHPQWPKDLFDMEWLLKHCGHHKWHVRNVRDRSDKEITLADFIQWSRDRVSCSASEDADDELLYGKDAPCPPEWRDWVTKSDILPAVLRPYGPTDLLRNLTESENVESLMCYLGVGDTFTPCHKDLCASSGQNIMCYTEDGGSSFWFMTASSDAPAAGEYFQRKIGQELDWEAHVVTVDEFAGAPFQVFVAEQKLGDLVLVPPRSCHQVVNHGGLTVKTSWSRMTLRGLETALYHELPIYRRVCRPEQYRVKYILYRTLLQRTAEIKALRPVSQSFQGEHPSSAPSSPCAKPLPSFTSYLAAVSSNTTSLSDTGAEDHISHIAREMADLIDMFDIILYEEYSSSHRRLPTIFSSAPSPARLDHNHPLQSILSAVRTPSKRKLKPSEKVSQSDEPQPLGNFCCDFCGADIFQSFFECNSCQSFHAEQLSSDDQDEVHPGDGVLICPPCYAEGRTCSCEQMVPGQCRPFSDLLRDRNEATAALSIVQTSPRYQELHEKTIRNSHRLKIFEAACRLQRMRNEVSYTRKCKCGYTGLAFEVFNCKPCHRSTCLRDLLTSGIHAAEVLLEYKDGGDRWHAAHKMVRADFKGNISELQEAERSGTVIERKDRLVFVAQRYRACRPLNPSNTRRGWYDEPDNNHSGNIDSTLVGNVLDHSLVSAALPVISRVPPSRPASTTTMSSEPQEADVVVVQLRREEPSLPSAQDSQPILNIKLSSPPRLQSRTGSPTKPLGKSSSTRHKVYVCVPPPPTFGKRPSSARKPVTIPPAPHMESSAKEDDSHVAATQLAQCLTAANAGTALDASPQRSSLPRRAKAQRIQSPSPERVPADARDDDGSPPKKKLKTTAANHNPKSIVKGVRGRLPGRAAAQFNAQDAATTSNTSKASEIAPTELSVSPTSPSSSRTLEGTPAEPDAAATWTKQQVPPLDQPIQVLPLEQGLQTTSAVSSIASTSTEVLYHLCPSATPTTHLHPRAALDAEGEVRTASLTRSAERFSSQTGPPLTIGQLVRVVEDVVENAVKDAVSRAATDLERRVEQLEKTNDRSHRLQEQLTESGSTLWKLESRLHDAFSKLLLQQSQLNDANNKIWDNQSQDHDVHGALRTLKEKVGRQETELRELKEINSRLESRLQTVVSEVETLHRDVEHSREAQPTGQLASAEMAGLLSSLLQKLTDATITSTRNSPPAQVTQVEAAPTEPAENQEDPVPFSTPCTPPRPGSSSDDYDDAITLRRGRSEHRQVEESRARSRSPTQQYHHRPYHPRPYYRGGYNHRGNYHHRGHYNPRYPRGNWHHRGHGGHDSHYHYNRGRGQGARSASQYRHYDRDEEDE